MKPAQHLNLLGQAVLAWLLFWLAGLPDYYQQYSTAIMGAACTLLSVAISLFALFLLSRGNPATRRSRALWLSIYYTLPFALLDTLYCAIYLNRGHFYIFKYWYLSIFYISPWLTFLPTASLLDRYDARQ